MSDKTEPSQKELLDLGKKLEQFYNLGYINKKQALSFSLYKGIASGAGVAIGGTVIIALLIWILSFFHQVPLASQLVNELRQAKK